MKIMLAAPLIACLMAPHGVWAQAGRPALEEPTLELPSLEEELGQTPVPGVDQAEPSLELPPEMPDQQEFELIPPKARIRSYPPLDFSPPPPPPPQAETEAQRLAKTVTLKALDKITARVSAFKAVIDQPARFGALQIIARNCHKRPVEETPETAAFLEITDLGPAYLKQLLQPVNLTAPALLRPEGKLVFSGWMFASSPALSALEHPIYDISVIDCSTPAPEISPGSE